MLGRNETLAAMLCLSLAAVGCGSDDGGGGCTTDVECKGDRVCESGVCVDPGGSSTDAGSGGSSASGSSGSGAGDGGGGDGGSGGSGAGSSGSGAGAGSTGSGGGGVIDDPELEQACSLDCEARKAADCPMDIGSLDQCLAQCLVVDETSQGYCLEEMTARYACLASGGYTCVSGYPQPQATCIGEGTALSECSQMTPCRAYCAVAAGDCAPDGDACLSTCMDDQNGFEDAICGVYYGQLLSCWTREGACEDGARAVGSCGPAIAEVADCIALRNDECDGYCWAAELLGCGSADCVSTCMAATDDGTCGSYYRRLIDCTISNSRELNLACEGSVPTPDATACASEIEQYDTCMQGI